MGNATYSVSDRAVRSTTAGYATKAVHDIFTQSREHKAHPDMDSRFITFRESRDSVAHPNAIPVQLHLDVTGSMGHIPHLLIKDGLPKLMSTLIQNGVPDVALMFAAIGDHETDNYPLQVGQFESGDAELDMWLTRTFLEGGGGGNRGESYLLAWYFAAFHVKTDAWEKRKQKGFVITIGDEPCLPVLPVSALRPIMGDNTHGQESFTAEQLLALAQETNHVYHIHVRHRTDNIHMAWRERLKDHLIEVVDYTTIPNVIAEIIMKHQVSEIPGVQVTPATDNGDIIIKPSL